MNHECVQYVAARDHLSPYYIDNMFIIVYSFLPRSHFDKGDTFSYRDMDEY
jgi:hypothetical protein